MARILIGWELGAGRGHTTRLIELSRLLKDRGHVPLFAPQQIGPFAAHGPTWQAPVWPRILQPLSRRFDKLPSTMGDILAYVGLDDTEAVAAMLMAWDKLIADAQPDCVVAEYAPMLQLSARSRVPTLAWGTGFSLPPSHLARFPVFAGEDAILPEEPLLSGLNRALRAAGRGPLAALPDIYTADCELVAAFEEFDPYRNWRQQPTGTPALSGEVPIASGAGEALFVYLNGGVRPPAAFWEGLVAAGLPVRVHHPGLNVDQAAALERAGIMIATDPVPFTEIAATSRLLLSHGGLGVVSSGLLAGLPQVAIPTDVEKKLNSDALANCGAGLQARFEGMDAQSFAAFIRTAWEDDALRNRARELAPQFRARVKRTAEAEAADIIEKLI